MSDDRLWYRSVVDGQRGYEVERGGKKCIRLDRPGQEILRPLNGDWTVDKEDRPFSTAQVGQCTLEVDKAVCHILGLHLESKREWLGMIDSARINWMTNGPVDTKGPIPGLRQRIFRAIMRELEPYTVK